MNVIWMRSGLCMKFLNYGWKLNGDGNIIILKGYWKIVDFLQSDFAHQISYSTSIILPYVFSLAFAPHFKHIMYMNRYTL